ncbi:hypothetical protein IC582_019671 [Cucumis melo]
MSLFENRERLIKSRKFSVKNCLRNLKFFLENFQILGFSKKNNHQFDSTITF